MVRGLCDGVCTWGGFERGVLTGCTAVYQSSPSPSPSSIVVELIISANPPFLLYPDRVSQLQSDTASGGASSPTLIALMTTPNSSPHHASHSPNNNLVRRRPKARNIRPITAPRIELSAHSAVRNPHPHALHVMLIAFLLTPGALDTDTGRQVDTL